MADNLSNTCEGTSGTTVSTSNSAGPNQFDSVSTAGAGTTQTWDNTHAHSGSTAMKNSLPSGVSAQAFADWTASISPTPVANAFARVYVYLTANPSINTRLAAFVGGAVTQCAVQIGTTGLLRLVNEAGSVAATTTSAVPLNAWCRIELDCTSNSGTTANLAARMFSGANLETSTPDSGGSVSASAQTTTALVATMRTGQTTATQTSAFTIWLDDIAFSDTQTPGPSVTAAPLPVIQAPAPQQQQQPVRPQVITGPPQTAAAAGLATASAAALQPSVTTSGTTNANAGLAAATGTALQPVLAVTITAGLATGSGAAPSPAAAVTVTAGLATGSGTALQPFVSATASSSLPAVQASFTAFPLPQPVAPQVITGPPQVTVTAGLATASGAALQPSVTTSGTTNAHPGLATATGTALQPVPVTTASAGLASGAGAALNGQRTVPAGLATAAGAAQGPVLTVLAQAAAATALAAALNATAVVVAPFTVGTLTAATAAEAVLTATDQKAGGPS